MVIVAQVLGILVRVTWRMINAAVVMLQCVSKEVRAYCLRRRSLHLAVPHCFIRIDLRSTGVPVASMTRTVDGAVMMRSVVGLCSTPLAIWSAAGWLFKALVAVMIRHKKRGVHQDGPSWVSMQHLLCSLQPSLASVP